MFTNFFVGLILPWLAAFFLIRKDVRLFLITFPFASMLAFIINNIAINSKLWMLKPFGNHSFSSLPFDIGFHPITACFMIYFIYTLNKKPSTTIIAFATLKTGLEFIYYSFNMVVYNDGVNFMWIFISYLIPLYLVYWYYRLLIKTKVF